MKNYVWLLLFLATFGLAGLFWYSGKGASKPANEDKNPIDQTLEGNTILEGPSGGVPGARTDAPSRPQVPQNNNQYSPPPSSGDGQNFQSPPPSFDPPQYEPPPYEPPPYDQVPPPPPPQKMDEFDNDPVSPPPPMEPPSFNNEGDYVPPPPPDGDDL